MSTFDEFWNTREAALADPTETTSEYAKRASEEAWNAALDAVTDLADSWRTQYDSASSSDELPTGHDCAEDLERRIDALLTCQPQLANGAL